jgi:hypothetical protein
MASNLSLNRTKSAEIVFVSPWSKREIKLPPSPVPGFERVESIKALGITVSRRFSLTQHVDNVLAAYAQTLFALRTLKHHGLPTKALHTIFQATVVAKLAYAAPRLVGVCQRSRQCKARSIYPSLWSARISRAIRSNASRSNASQNLRGGRDQVSK